MTFESARIGLSWPLFYLFDFRSGLVKMKELNTMVSTSQAVETNGVIIAKNGKKADNGKFYYLILFLETIT